jgi:predicted dithiol-disulfide oxidoreductase (DUF899 family)
MTEHKIGTRQQWEAARAELLEREKEYTRQGDELARQGNYPILDRTLNGRDEANVFQTWLRRHDEYDELRSTRRLT